VGVLKVEFEVSFQRRVMPMGALGPYGPTVLLARDLTDCVCVEWPGTDSVAAPIAEQLRQGATFHGRYEVRRIIDSGGMGTVYEVLDRRTQRQRALKTMHPNLVVDPDLRSRFHFEATANTARNKGPW